MADINERSGNTVPSARGVNRRRFLQGCVAAGAATALRRVYAAEGAVSSGGAGRRPNIIFLVTDDQRADSMSCAGNTILKTPHIDTLAAGGMRFRESFTTTAICMSSRASILTGLYTRCHGIDNFDKPLAQPLLEASYPLLLRQAGYRTGFVGKWGLGGALPKNEFDYFTGYPGQGHYFQTGQTKHLTTLQAEQAVEFLRGYRKDQPFCLAVSFKAPHVQDEGRYKPGIYAKYPYDRALEGLFADATVPWPRTRDAQALPAFFDQTFNRTREGPDFSDANYQEAMKALYRLITGVDMAVGRIMDEVRALGVEDNTVVVCSSDHGSFYGEHGFGGKWLMLEESIRTPLIVCDPRLPRQLHGTQCDQMVLNIDLMPTVLDLAGVAIPPSVQGRSLLPLVRGEQPQWRQEWFYEHPFSAGGSIAVSEGIRTNRWKYVRYIQRQPLFEQLFDLQADPREEKNLATEARHQETLSRMRTRWTAWRQGLATWRHGAPWTEPAVEG